MRQPTLSLVIQKVVLMDKAGAPKGRTKRALESYLSLAGCEAFQTQKIQAENCSNFEWIPQLSHTDSLAKGWSLTGITCLSVFLTSASWPLNYVDLGNPWVSKL